MKSRFAIGLIMAVGMVSSPTIVHGQAGAPGYPSVGSYQAAPAGYQTYGQPQSYVQQQGYGAPTPAASRPSSAYVAQAGCASGAGGGYAAPSASYGYSAAPAYGTQGGCAGGGAVDGGCANGGYVDAGYGGAYFDAMGAGGWDGGCGGAIPQATGAGCPTWFGGVYGLIMTRDDSNPIYFAYDPNIPRNQYLSSADANMDYSGGVEARIGRTFGCCRWGLELVYWGIYPSDSQASITSFIPPAPTGNMVWPTNSYSDTRVDDGAGGFIAVDDLFNPTSTFPGATQFIQIRRSQSFHNVELNLISAPLFVSNQGFGGGCGGGGFGGGGFGAAGYGAGYGMGGYGAGGCGAVDYGCGGGACGGGCGACGGGCGVMPCGGGCGCGVPRMQVGYALGVRYFQFDEGFFYGVDRVNNTFDYLPHTQEFFHTVDVENSLVGVQLGLNLNYYLTKCTSLEAGTKFGLYGNRMTVAQHAFNGFGDASRPDGTFFNYSQDDNDAAFLGEIRVGLGHKIGCHWRLTGGYRAVAISGVALATDQIRHDRSMAHYEKGIARNGDLILHGAYAGAEFAW